MWLQLEQNYLQIQVESRTHFRLKKKVWEDRNLGKCQNHVSIFREETFC